MTDAVKIYNYLVGEGIIVRNRHSVSLCCNCLRDLLNYTSALRGMAPEKRRQMFGSYPFMLGWLKELGKLAKRITGVLDRLRTDNRLPDGTRNDEDKEEES